MMVAGPDPTRKLARNCVLAAQNTYHGVLTHLAFTHLMSEAVLLAAVRNLAAVHPVAVLLRRHFEGTMTINKLAVDVLIQPGRAVEYLIGSDLKTTYPFIAEHRKELSRSPATTCRRSSSGRGTDSVAALPVLPVPGRRPAGVDGDPAVGRRVRRRLLPVGRRRSVRTTSCRRGRPEVASPDGGAIRDFGAGAGSIADRTDLAAPHHGDVDGRAAARRGQLHPSSSIWATLPATRSPASPPSRAGREHTRQDWLDNLPPLDVAVQQLCVMRLLGVIHETKLGDYRDDFKHTPVAGGLHGFQQELAGTEDEIVPNATGGARTPTTTCGRR